MIRTFRYIAHDRLADALACGWLPTGGFADCHHGAYSALCEWLCDCPLPGERR